MDMLPIFYFRPTVICIDDDLITTSALGSLISKVYPFHAFNNSKSMMGFLNNYHSFLNEKKFLRNFEESEYSDSSYASIIEFNYNNILELINAPEIKKEIAVLISDYYMPEVDGISLCQQLKDYPFKKLLLTDSNDYKAGLSAFNKGIINQFVNKSTPAEEILNKVEELSFMYFADISNLLKQHLESEHQLPLSDKLFINYFMNLFKELQIKEFYLADKNGSILMIDDNNVKSLLIVHTDKSLSQFLRIYRSDPYVDIYTQVQLKEKIPYLGLNNDNVLLSPVQLSNRLYTPDLLIGRETYYIHRLILNERLL